MNNFLRSKFEQLSVPFSNVVLKNSVVSDENDPKLEYDQHDNLISKKESIKRIFWMVYLLSTLMAFALTFLIAFILWLATPGPELLLPHEIPENMYQPYLHILHKNGIVDICELEMKKGSRFHKALQFQYSLSHYIQ